MSNRKINDPYLLLKEIFNESFIIDLTLFCFLYFLILTQSWENVFLFLFPLISFAFALFFKIISTNKWRIEFENRPIIYNPLGLEKKNANRFNFSAILQLIFLFWIGAESMYHPQLIDNYYIYFIVIFIFIYSFGFYWIFIDIWRYCRIEIACDKKEFKEIQQDNSLLSSNLNNVVSFLKIKNFKKISIINFSNFVILNSLNILFAVFQLYDLFPGIPFNLPGTGFEDSEPILLSHVLLIVLISSPTLTIIFLILIYKEINNFNKEKLDKILEPLPKNFQIKVIENLRAMKREKSKERLKLD